MVPGSPLDAAHFIIYLILGILSMNALLQHPLPKGRRFLLAQSICIVYAMTDELHQIFINGRGPGVADVLIDSLGAFVGILLLNLLNRKAANLKYLNSL